MLHTFLLLAASVLLAELLAPDTYPVELLATARPWISAALVILTVTAAVRLRPLSFAVALSLTVLHVLGTLAPLQPSEGAIGGAAAGPTVRVRVLTANLYDGNRSAGPLLQLIEDTSPDIVVLQEAHAGWAGALARTGRFPAMRSSGELIIASRFPFDSRPEPMAPSELGQRILRAQVRVTADGLDAAVPLVVYTAHPRSPRTPHAWEERNAVLARLGLFVRQEPQGIAVVVAGDLNTTPWSTHFRRLLNHGQLTPGSSPWLMRATYFPQRDWPDWFGVPIDHVLARSPSTVLNRRVTTSVGSDHLPVVAEIDLPLPVD
jgi:endonuclease/exonuclease/phosphatase (EEP) superfamily protein YafD